MTTRTFFIWLAAVFIADVAASFLVVFIILHW